MLIILEKMGNLNQNSIIVESPWKKIIVVGIFIIILVVITEFIGRFINISMFMNTDLLKNSYLLFFSIIFISLVLIILVIFLIKHKKKTINNKINRNISDSDVKKVFEIIDNLLDKLPEEEIKKFSKSKESERYRKVLNRYGIK